MTKVLNFPVPSSSLPVSFDDQTVNGVNLAQDGDSVTITDSVAPPPPVVTLVSVSGPATLLENATAQFTAAVKGQGAYDPSVVWSASDGVITQTGLFTAPAKVENVTITATSKQTPAVAGNQQVSISNPTNTVVIQPSGGDDTAAVLTGLQQTAAKGQILQLALGTWHLNPIVQPDNSNLLGTPGCLLTDQSVYPANQPMIQTGNNTKLTLTGCFLQMPLTYGTGQRSFNGNHGVLMTGTNPIVTGISCSECGADGFYVRSVTNGVLSGVSASKCGRNALSITGKVNGLTVNNYSFSNSRNLAQAGIAAGIDIEPDGPGDFLENIVFNNGSTNGNQWNGVSVGVYQLSAADKPLSITFNNHVSNNNDQYGILFTNNGGAAVGGTVDFNNCSTDSSGFGGAYGRWSSLGAVINFNNLLVTNPNRLGKDSHYAMDSAVGVGLDGGSASPTFGNVNFKNITISNPNRNPMQNYFQFASNGSPAKITFVAASCTGAVNANSPTKYP